MTPFTKMDGEEGSRRDGWMDDGGKEDFGINLYGMDMNTNGSMLNVPPLTLHRDKYHFRCLTPSEEVTHEFYKQLYPNIIRDIDGSS